MIHHIFAKNKFEINSTTELILKFDIFV